MVNSSHLKFHKAQRLKHPYAIENGNVIFPEEADSGVGYQCPYTECDDELRVRSGQMTLPHFWHPNSDADHKGDSWVDERYKRFAAAGLKQMYAHRIEEDTVDDCLNVTKRFDGITRTADALCTFTEPLDGWGKGIVIKVLHRDTGEKYPLHGSFYRDGYSLFATYTYSDVYYSKYRYKFTHNTVVSKTRFADRTTAPVGITPIDETDQFTREAIEEEVRVPNSTRDEREPPDTISKWNGTRPNRFVTIGDRRQLRFENPD